MNTHPCGCTNAPDPASGVLRSVSKCRTHRAQARDPRTLDARYYEELGVVDGAGRLKETRHVAELIEALGELPRTAGDLALEVGCGASPYVGAIRDAGWTFLGIDPSRWASDWAWRHWQALVFPVGLDGFDTAARFGLILAAHCLEHMADAPGAIRQCAELLGPGGELWVVVPDDSDPVNADHVWFFDETTLAACVEAAGLTLLTLAVRQYVAHERFLYARAVRR